MKQNKDELICSRIRMKTLDICREKKWGHLSSSLSLVEILYVLYAKIKQDELLSIEHNLILSKGHGAAALYAAQSVLKVNTEIDHMIMDNKIKVHPQKSKELGIPFTTGSLGHGLAIGLGCSIGDFKQDNKSKTYIIMGDGELQEGSVWEAAKTVTRLKAKNIIVIVDENHLQASMVTETSDGSSALVKAWESIGWKTEIVNGHCCDHLRDSIFHDNSNTPLIVFAQTTKGKGVTFIENNKDWHFRTITDREYELAIGENQIC